HTSKDDYLINTLRFVSRKEASQIYGAVLPECLTSLEMKESKAYKTYLGYATGAVTPKIARKFKKASPSKKDSVPVQADEEPVQKGKRVKRHAKKSTTTPVTGIVIREAFVETKSKRKEKEKVDVAQGKGIELPSEVALTEKAQLKKVRKKSLRDFHKTHPSGSGTVAEKPPSVEKITPTITSEGTSDKPGVPDVTEDDSTESESESWGNDEDDSNNEQESSNEGSEQENESEEQESDSEQDEESDDDNQEEEEVDQENESEDDEIESDEDKGMDDTTDQFDDDVDARLEEPTKTGIEVVQGEGADVEMNEAQQGNENLETTQEQVVDDAHVTITTVMKKTEVPVTSSSRSSDLASKFLNFSDIPHTDAEIVSPLDVHVHHEVPRTQAPTLLIIPVSVITESSSDPLHTQVTSLVDEHLDTRLRETREEFMNFLSESLTARIKEQVKDQLPQILPKEVSNFALSVIEKLIKESRDEVTLEKVSSQPQSTYEAASTLTEFELKKILLDKMEKNFFFSYDVYSLKRSRKDKDKDEDPFARSDRRKFVQSEEPVFEVVDSDMPQDQEGNMGVNEDETRNETASRRPVFRLLKGTRSNYAELENDFEECYKALSEKLDWENPEGGGILTMAYTTSTTKTKAAKYDLPGIEDMVPNIWSPIKAAYDRYALWAVTHVKVTRKHGYGYLEEIVVRRADNALYRFKEGDFPRLRINDIEDMLLLVVQNRLTNLSWDDVADFAIALWMFTRSLVIQKRVEDLQLGVESYQKKTNITKP
ncbi:hypothetical protein Tco_1399032, partial [Tanacetum coccineum]